MVKLAVPFLVLLTAVPADADGLSGLIDYEALFAQHADDVVTFLDTPGLPHRELVLDGGILLREMGPEGNRSFVGIDQSGQAVGCLLLLMAELRALAAECPDFASAEEAGKLDANIARLSDFYANNLVPPRPRADMQALVAQGIIERGQRFRGDDPAFCASAEQHKPMVASMLSDYFIAALDEALATPRLPVTNPCL